MPSSIILLSSYYITGTVFIYFILSYIVRLSEITSYNYLYMVSYIICILCYALLFVYQYYIYYIIYLSIYLFIYIFIIYYVICYNFMRLLMLI